MGVAGLLKVARWFLVDFERSFFWLVSDGF